MKKMKLYKKILIVIFVLIICNVAYYIESNWQNIFKTANSSAGVEAVDMKTYSSSKMKFEVKYPSTWIVQDTGTTVSIDPAPGQANTHFSVALRSEFKSLDDVKQKLATTVVLNPVQINNATGFEYDDSSSYKNTWLVNGENIYLVRTYTSISMGDLMSNQILSTFKFNN